jgi:large subunit ribosomal protein L15
MKLKKRHKVGRMRGSSRHGWGARKKHISSGHKGGKGMSGTGKMAGHKKTLVTKLYGMGYFGKQGFTSRGSKRDETEVMNLRFISLNMEMIKEKYGKKEGKETIIDLSKFKILGDGEISEKLIIKASAFSASAKEKIEKAGGKTIVIKGKKTEEETSEEKEE